MPNQLRLAFAREEEIASLLSSLSEKTGGFRSPKLILIGGYALRAFVPFSRSTRDCDFALRKGTQWLVNSIQAWLPGWQTIARETHGDYGFLRCMKLIKAGRTSAKVSVDFMEGMVVGRSAGEQIKLDEVFERHAQRVGIDVADKEIEVVVPSYRDYFIMKVVSGRRSDIRDIAAMVWKLGIPSLGSRVEEILPTPSIFRRKVEEVIIPDLEDARFVHSWRGTFVSEEFSEKDARQVAELLRSL